jgi:transcriptional regulator with XRE-family HTH domain
MNAKDAKLAATVGGAARAARRQRGRTQEDIAAAVGVSAEFYARIERGRTLPSVPTLLRLALALDASADALLGLGTVSAGGHAPRRDAAPATSPAIRRVTRRLSRARPSTLRLVSLLLLEVDVARRKSTRGE